MLKRVIKSVFYAFGVKIQKTPDGLLFSFVASPQPVLPGSEQVNPDRQPAQPAPVNPDRQPAQPAPVVSAPSNQELPPLFPPKFNAEDVEFSYLRVRERWNDRQTVILKDDYMEPIPLPATQLVCKPGEVDQLNQFDLKNTIFLYACDSDELGLPYIKEIVKRGGTFFPSHSAQPSLYANINDLARQVIESEYQRQTRENFQKFDYGPGDFLNIIQAIEVTAHLSGTYLEIGCFRGSSACIAVEYMKLKGLARDCYFLDVFEGFVYQVARESSDIYWEGTHMTEGEEIIRQRIAASSHPAAGLNTFVIKSNVIEEELPPETGAIAIANIDVDLYEAVSASLLKVAPKIVPGGIMIVEDPGHTPALIGSRLALQEFLELPIAKSFMPIYLESGQTFLIKLGI